MKKSTRYIVLLGVLVILVGLFVWYKTEHGKYDNLANCLKKAEVKFYGAFWCPHCHAQKQDFGKSATLLPYIECSNADGQSQNKTCNDANIQSYPTWEFPNPLTIEGSSADTSVACKTPYTSSQPEQCQGAAAGSWVTTTSGREFLSPSKPSQTGTTWTLPALSRTSGEVPLPLLGALTNCPVN